MTRISLLLVISLFIAGSISCNSEQGDDYRATQEANDQAITRINIEPASNTLPSPMPEKEATTNVVVGAEPTPSVLYVGVKASDPTIDASANSPSNNGTYAFFAIALALSVFLNLTLLRWYWWRKKLPDDSKVPADVMHQQMNAQTTEFEKLAQVVMDSAEVLANTQGKHGQELSGIKESFLLLQQEIRDKNAEIKRLREGYDSKIFRDFVQRFIRVDIALGEDIERVEDPSLLEQFRELLVDALEECGVDYFNPVIGTNVRSAKIENYEEVGPAPTADQEYLITKIIKPGYMLNDVVIGPATVAAYGRFEENNDG